MKADWDLVQLVTGGLWPILAASLIYATDNIVDGAQTGRHIADGSIFFCKHRIRHERRVVAEARSEQLGICFV